MKAREAQVALLFSDNYYIKAEWSAKTAMSNPLKPMHTLDISSGGDPNIEQAELFMSSIWALLMAYPKQFSVLIPVFYAMREQFLLDEITWIPPINDQPKTFSDHGMTEEYQKMFLIQDRLLGDMLRIVSPELVMGTQKIRMVKVKGMEESQYYATRNSGFSAIYHMIYLHRCMAKDAVNLLQRRIEAMAGDFISGPILTKIGDYRKLLQTGKAAKVTVGYHEVVRKSAMRLQSRTPAAYSITSKFIEP
jgi:hypothetical protein